MRASFYHDPQHGKRWIKQIRYRLEQEESERRFLTRNDFEFDREYRMYMRATLNREGAHSDHRARCAPAADVGDYHLAIVVPGGVHHGVAVQLRDKIETYNPETKKTNVLHEKTIGTYKPTGAGALPIQARTLGDDDASLSTNGVSTGLLQSYVALCRLMWIPSRLAAFSPNCFSLTLSKRGLALSRLLKRYSLSM